MSDIITERSGNILRIQLNRPARKNAMTSAMYITLADLLNDAAKDDQIRVVLWHGAGDSFSAGNDIQDFLKNPPGAGESPQARLIEALINFDKPIVAAVQGRGNRRRNHDVNSLRLCVRGRERKIPNAVR
jgi:enoyl-CoA hydratase/carnithine racemase